MIIVSCPNCYKATYVVITQRKKHEQVVECGYCKNAFRIRVKPRGRGDKVDAECFKLDDSNTT